MTTLDIVVRAAHGTYIARHKGVAASCTAGEQQAATSLGTKLFGLSLVRCVGLGARADDLPGITRWQLVAEPVFAWAWASGLLEIGRGPIPKDALPVATGMHIDLQLELAVTARHGEDKTKGQLLVPGSYDASDDDQVLDALISWLELCNRRNKPVGTVKYRERKRDEARLGPT